MKIFCKDVDNKLRIVELFDNDLSVLNNQMTLKSMLAVDAGIVAKSAVLALIENDKYYNQPTEKEAA